MRQLVKYRVTAYYILRFETRICLEVNLYRLDVFLFLFEWIYSKDTVPITPAEVCYYALALSASCGDPHNFHGHNLIGKLSSFIPS